VDLHAFSLIEQIELYGWKAFERRAIHIRASFRRLWALHKVDAMTVANPTLFPLAKIVNRNSRLIAGMTDVERFNPRFSSPESRFSTNIQVFYLGNFLSWQGCDLLLEAARILIEDKNAPYDFNFVGGSAQDREKNNQEWQRFVNTDRMRFLGSVDYDQIPAKFQQADILVIPRPWMLSTYLAFPGKISDYMASGKAILATNLKPHRYAIKDSKNGVLCEATSQGIVAGLLRLQDHDVRIRLGQQARLMAEKMFDKKNQARQALEFLQQVYDKKHND
jgi:glycosyltransferase involved in cell wall biosynthesis